MHSRSPPADPLILMLKETTGHKQPSVAVQGSCSQPRLVRGCGQCRCCGGGGGQTIAPRMLSRIGSVVFPGMCVNENLASVLMSGFLQRVAGLLEFLKCRHKQWARMRERLRGVEYQIKPAIPVLFFSWGHPSQGTRETANYP